MTSIVDILTAGSGGGLLGIFGQTMNRVVGMLEHKQVMEKLRFEAEVAGRKDLHEIELLNLEMKATTVEKEHAIELTNVQGDWEIKKASYALDDGADKAGPTAAFIRTTMRPFLTYGLLTAAMLLTIMGFGGPDTKSKVIEATISMGCMCVAWWFGERGSIRAPASK